MHKAGTADSEVGLAILLARQSASASLLLGRAATRDIRPSFRTLLSCSCLACVSASWSTGLGVFFFLKSVRLLARYLV